MLLSDPVAQSVWSSSEDSGVVSLIPAQFHTLVEIDHEIISWSFSSFANSKRDIVRQAKICTGITG